MALEPYEKETIIRYDEESDMATVFTYDTEIMDVLKRAKVKPLRVGKDGRTKHATYEVPRSWVKIVPVDKQIKMEV